MADAAREHPAGRCVAVTPCAEAAWLAFGVPDRHNAARP